MTEDDDADDIMYVWSTIPDPNKHPSLRHVVSHTISNTRYVKREVMYCEIFSERTGEFKGRSIGFRTFPKQRGELKNEVSKSFTLDNDEEIRDAMRFMQVVTEGSIPRVPGKLMVLPATADAEVNVRDLKKSIERLSDDGKSDLLIKMLNQVAQAPEMFESLIKHASENPELFTEAAAALNLARYKNDLNELKYLIENYESENDFQQFLKKHPWLFGSEYSELLERRVYVRDSQFDFVVRRTSDAYIEIIEIKTPLRDRRLFSFDESRECYFPSRDLSMVIGQVQKYIEELDLGRLEINFRDQEDTNKIKARIIIGRDVDDEQCKALRSLNGHLHRIEIITFDQLVRIAERVVDFLKALVSDNSLSDLSDDGPVTAPQPWYDLDDDIPF